MGNNSTTKNYFSNNTQDTYSMIMDSPSSYVLVENSQYKNLSSKIVSNKQLHLDSPDVAMDLNLYLDSTIERVAQWFLNKTSMSNKKLQKLCYYAYCWYIVFFNDIEAITKDNIGDICVLTANRFQAWIHGPVSPYLYNRYKAYGWRDIPMVKSKPVFSAEIESLLEQVWCAYGSFTANELETISHGEMPWKNARKGYLDGDACTNEISTYDILYYYSNLK